MQVLDLTIRAGEYSPFSLDLVDAAGAPLPVSGYTSEFLVFENDASTVPVLSLTDGSGTTLTTGQLGIALTGVQTLQLLTDLAKRRSGRYAASITGPTGDKTFVAAGKLTIVKMSP